MTTVDKRIVEMKFDNQQFEQGVHTTVKSLERLREGLKLDSAAQSLSNLDQIAKGFSLTGVSQGMDALVNRFSTLGIVGLTALQNITNSAINSGTNLVKALTIDPIKTGLEEYETKMNSITTILTNTKSKGTTLDDVNEALAQLNEYSDKTIYNFSEMARNIGTFTAAGIDLDTSVQSIKGIANLAAGSGSNAQQAATAMYQLSQALASGSVKLMDWNSVVNAGMGGELFKNALKDTAKELGIFVDESKPFRETLESGWITAEVLTKTLSKMADDPSLLEAATQVKTFTQLLGTMKETVQSGWAVSWESIIGSKDQAAKSLTAINDAFGALIGSSTDSRNEMLKFWNVNGGRAALIQAITNSFKALGAILKPISEAFREVFPATTGERLVEISKGILNFTKKFKIGEDTTNNIKNTFKGLFAVLDIGKQVIGAFAGVLGILIKFLLPVVNAILYFTGAVGKFLYSIDEAIRSSGVFGDVIKALGAVFVPIAEAIQDSLQAIIEAFSSIGDVDMTGIDSFSEKVKKRFSVFGNIGEAISNMFVNIGESAKKAFPTLYKFASSVANGFKVMQESIINGLASTEYNNAFDVFNSGLFAAILIGLRKFIKSLSEFVSTGGGILSGITGILDGVRGCLKAYQTQLKANTLLTIATAIGILAIALLLIASIDSKKLTASLGAITVMFIELFAAMAVLNGVTGAKGMFAMAKITLSMIALSIAILILASAMTKLSKLDWGGIAKGLVAIAGLSVILVTTSNMLSRNSGPMIRGAIGIVIFAAALNLLVNAVTKLGTLKTSTLAKGLIGIGILIAELALFMKTTDIMGMGIGKGVGILVLAVAISILAQSVIAFSKIKTKDLAKGLVALGVVLAQISLFVRLTGKSKNMIATAIGLTILAEAITILAKAIKLMGAMPIKQIGKGLLALAGALAIILLMLKFMPKNIFIQSLALMDIAGAIYFLGEALEKLGKLSLKEIGKALLALAGSFIIIVSALKLITGEILDATALSIVAVGIFILAKALKTLGTMSLEQIGLSLLALAGAFIVIGVAATLLTPVIPAIFGIAIAISLLGAACLAVGAGILMLSAGLAALAVSGAAGSLALVALVTSIIGLIPMFLEQVGIGILALAKVISTGGPAISAAITTIMLAFIEAFRTVTPQVISAAIFLLTSLLTAFVTFIPKLVDMGMKLVIGFLEGISKNIKNVVKAGTNIIVQFLKGVQESLATVIQAAFDLIITFINGLANAIRSNSIAINDAVYNLVTAIVKAIFSLNAKFVDAGKKAILGFVSGMKSKIGDAAKSAAAVARSAYLAAKRELDEHSPSRAFAEIGKFAVEGLALGLRQYTDLVAEEGANIGRTAIVSLSDAVANIASVLDSDLDISPTIRPVLDLTNVVSGSKTMNSLFGQTPGIVVGNVTARAAAISPAIPAANAATQNTLALQKSLDDLKKTIDTGAQTVKHSGEITIKGVNDKEQLIGITKIFAEEFAEGNRRIPTRVSILPSQA